MQELYVPQECYMRRALELAEYAASLGRSSRWGSGGS